MNVVILVSILLIGYTFVGYPLYLYAKNKRAKDSRLNWKYPNREISVLLIACNEANYIREKVKNILSLNYDQDRIRLIIVDDASEDSTVEIIESIDDPRITLVKQKRRSGKAAGINLGMNYINSELVMLVDARQSISANSLRDLASWFYPESDVVAVSGEVRFRKEDGDESSGMDAYQRYEKFIRSTEAKINGVPGVSGALYMLKRDSFQSIPEDTILDDVLIPMVASQNGGWVGFDDRAVAWDIPSNDMDREKRRKTRTLNGNYQLLFRNLNWCIPSGHPLWFEFLSHKVSRLTAPFLAIIALIFSGVLAIEGSKLHLMLTVLIAATILTYPIVSFAPFLQKIKVLKILSSFVALNWFNLLGFIDYVISGKKTSWK